jgi:hypothetical protein
MVPPRTRGETFAHAQLMAPAEALREAKPAIVISPITDEMQAVAIEKLIAQHNVVVLRPMVRQRRSATLAAHCSAKGQSRAGGERNGAARPLGVQTVLATLVAAL